MPPPTADDDLVLLARLAGGPIASAEPAAWGTSSRTMLVTRRDGRRVVVQRPASGIAAGVRLRVARLLDDRLRGAGVPVPQLLAGDRRADAPPHLVTERIDGDPGNVLLDDPIDAIALATEMGRLARVVASVDVADVRLPGTWADPAALASSAERWLARVDGELGVAGDAAGAQLARIPDAFAGRPAVLAHGDWVPVNVLVRGRGVVGVVDWEQARLADPLFDLAWWSWIIRVHHPDRYGAAMPALFETAGVTLDEPTLERCRLLVVARLLEVAGAGPGRGPRAEAARAAWLMQLRELLGPIV
jgi:aminoglycoside phosphotransferase (APT) family kinase protein